MNKKVKQREQYYEYLTFKINWKNVLIENKT
jgi:hypothetical protein